MANPTLWRNICLLSRRPLVTWLTPSWTTSPVVPALTSAAHRSRFSTGLSQVRLAKESGPASSPDDEQDLREMKKPSDFEKRVLVAAGLYKKVEEVPDRISTTKMKKAQDFYRVRISIYMLIVAFFGSILMIMLGRRARDAGDSLDVRGKAQMAEWQRQGADERETKRRLAEANDSHGKS